MAKKKKADPKTNGQKDLEELLNILRGGVWTERDGRDSMVYGSGSIKRAIALVEGLNNVVVGSEVTTALK